MRRYPEYKDSGVEWIGNIPRHWNVAPLFSCTSNRNINNENNIITNVLSLSYGRIIKRDVESNRGLLPESFETYQIVQQGNIILRLTDLQNDKRSLRVGLCREGGIITSAYSCIQSSKNIIEEYLYYLLHSYDIHKVFYNLGGGLRQTLRFSDLKLLPIFIPSIEEQRNIANYLDKRTSQIDSLIEKKKRLIELLKEYRTAIINHAVTKGLDPNVKLKDSGIEWIGEIPEHWEVVGMTKYINSIVDYRGRTPEKIEEGVFLITARNIKNGNIDYTLSQEYISDDEYMRIIKRGAPKIGDVLFTTEAPLGEVANVDNENIALAQRIIKFRAIPEKLYNYYLKYWILSGSFQNDLQSHATGSTALGIKASKLNLLQIALPPVLEQNKIVEYLDRQSKSCDSIIQKQYRVIDYLKEYRTSLISDAVTGKIDVRDYSERVSEPGVT